MISLSAIRQSTADEPYCLVRRNKGIRTRGLREAARPGHRAAGRAAGDCPAVSGRRAISAAARAGPRPGGEDARAQGVILSVRAVTPLVHVPQRAVRSLFHELTNTAASRIGRQRL